MGLKCDQCGKEYVHKRNLKRHTDEHHSNKEHWNCAVSTCEATFIRREYLAKHLVLFHGYDKATSRECAINAIRGDRQFQTHYYEDISEDDSILDLIAEADSASYSSDGDHFTNNFDTQWCEDYGLHVNTKTVTKVMNADMVQQNISPDDIADMLNEKTFGDSADDVVIGEESMDGINSRDEDDSHNIDVSVNTGDIRHEDEGVISTNNSDGLGDINGDYFDNISDDGNSDSNNKEDGDSGSVNGDDGNNNEAGDISACVDDDNGDYEISDDVNSDSNNIHVKGDDCFNDEADDIGPCADDNSDDYVFSDDDNGDSGKGEDGYDSDKSDVGNSDDELNGDIYDNTDQQPIYISSDDELMTNDLAVPDEKVVTEILTMTFIKTTRYINNGPVYTFTKMERDYNKFEK